VPPVPSPAVFGAVAIPPVKAPAALLPEKFSRSVRTLQNTERVLCTDILPDYFGGL
jgi:hypothetical protein